MLELNLFAFWWPCHLFQIWILCLAQHRLVSTLQSYPTREKGREIFITFHYTIRVCYSTISLLVELHYILIN